MVDNYGTVESRTDRLCNALRYSATSPMTNAPKWAFVVARNEAEARAIVLDVLFTLGLKRSEILFTPFSPENPGLVNRYKVEVLT